MTLDLRIKLGGTGTVTPKAEVEVPEVKAVAEVHAQAQTPAPPTTPEEK